MSKIFKSLIVYVFRKKATNFDLKHNICCVLDDTHLKMTPFKDILPFFERSKIKKVVTKKHPTYVSHVERSLEECKVY
ncbi:hypothetical protein Hanom_Chr07g00629691 [Helianthus anomalus]